MYVDKINNKYLMFTNIVDNQLKLTHNKYHIHFLIFDSLSKFCRVVQFDSHIIKS